ncbi:Gryzun, putative trafficking through golgi-domain-containing protein [Polychytrium aggregatum]|uniref:Gryzun, putative trafficking through golgi-domain-containing protein n=1 Tax=Polychytrium aggregatum TaxID=110093 RepID=UPI0022FEA205|nr:Gryzun, putative trafficking through golgi-domain-containing protein [Polychytrium aggregatum]KAI9203606.1 Gryzun, putative trafficking through golgi-domain-containing protein [Polychytrium aggregatum]
MESYPLEYVLHHVPLMGVLGLQPSVVESPPPSSPLVESLASLKESLLTILVAKNNLGIWDTTTAVKLSGFFHVVSLGKDHVFTAHKLPGRPPATPLIHSPLSPLTPGSPLHPGGMMCPQWVRKHREILPSVVLGFYDLVDSSLAVNDTVMAAEIIDRKKTLGERGIKYAVILLCRVGTPDDETQIEDRLAFLKKNCGLDPKSSVFVIPFDVNRRSTTVDLLEFVTSMQRTLFESALNYYREHVKRVKKKKSKFVATSPTRSPQPAPGARTSDPSGLSAQGWGLRYDYKLAVFTEFQQNMEGAIKLYETCYDNLLELLRKSAAGPTLLGADSIPPGSPRWTEARALLDTINLKICKLHLYTEFPLLALEAMNRHLRCCKILPEFAYLAKSNLPPPPGLSQVADIVGGGTHEYWSWVSKQYRIFGELIELATSKSRLSLPYPPPGTLGNGGAAALLNTVANNGMNVLTGGEIPATSFSAFSMTNPANFVQHAGYYYYMSAKAAEEAWRKFKEIAEVIEDPSGHDVFSKSTLDLIGQDYLNSSLEQGKAVDHGALTIELFTKSYEQFRKQKSGRITLFLAAEIARVYERNSQYEMALKFYERIGKTYRKEKWNFILKSILESTVRCASELALWDIVLDALVELMSESVLPHENGRIDVLNQLLTVLNYGSLIPGSPTGAHPDVSIRKIVDMDQMNAFIQCSVQFKKTEAYAGCPVPFQVTLTSAGATSPPIPLRFSKVQILFSVPRYDYCLFCSDEVASTLTHSTKPRLILLDCTDAKREVMKNLETGSERKYWTKTLDLEVAMGSTVVVEGVVNAADSQDIKIRAVGLVLESPLGHISLNYRIADRGEGAMFRRKWMTVDKDGAPKIDYLPDGYGEQSLLRVSRRQPNIRIQVIHDEHGYLDELYPVDIEITNEEDSEIHVLMDAEFRSSMSSDDAYSQIFESHPGNAAAAGSNQLSGLSLGAIAAHSKLSRRLWLRCDKFVGERLLILSVQYGQEHFAGSSLTTEPVDPASVPTTEVIRMQETARIAFTSPFDVKFDIIAQKTRRLALREGEERVGLLGFASGASGAALEKMDQFSVLANIKTASSNDMEIESVVLKAIETTSSPQIDILDVPVHCHTLQVWKPGSLANYVYHVRVTSDILSGSKPLSFGRVEINWKRRFRNKTFEQSGSQWATTTVKLPPTEPPKPVVQVFTDLPPQIEVGRLFTVQHVIENPSLQVVELHATIEAAEGFVFSGYKQTGIRILPLSSARLQYNCIALLSGQLTPPKIKIIKKELAPAAGPGNPVGPSPAASAATIPKTSDIEIAPPRDITIFVKPNLDW